MLNERVRDYEVSIWTLQDSFITVLKPSNLENKGQIQEGVMNIKNDNTLELTFSIPMYLYDGPIRKENPIWYNTRNGNIVVNMRKIKLIFNKKTELEEVFEFLITEVTERHEGNELYCDVTCEGLAFHELGKIGYKIELNQDDYLEEWKAWSEEAYEDEDEHKVREPHNNIDYWIRKVLYGTNWSYEISMDWGAYDGIAILRYINPYPPLIDYALIDVSTIYSSVEDLAGNLVSYEDLTDEEKMQINKMREEKGLRRNDTLYEDEYVASWEEENGMLTPKETVKTREKYRVLDEKESNIYNLTQAIAEIFGVYCKYIYVYDNDYHIINRKVVFYNNFIQEIDGELGITYPYDAKSIERTMDSTDIITKMFVKNLTDSNMESGEAAINNVEANPSKEDYLLNFDYLYSIGTISEEQYAEIQTYELEMRRLNEALEPLQSQLIEYQNKYTDASAAETIAKNAVSLDTERISASDDLLNALTEGTGRISVTAARPDICYIISNTVGGGYCINIRQEGIIANTIHVYKNYDISSLTLEDEITGYRKEVDEYGNLTGKLSNFPKEGESSMVYVIYDYEPQLYYENIKKIWQLRKNNDQQEYLKQKKLAEELDGVKDKDGNRISDGLIQTTEVAINDILEQKRATIQAFERMMGPALREGTWQPEDEYANYGDKYSENLDLTFTSTFNNGLVSIGWDNEAFDDEQKNYYETGVELKKVYYPCIDLTNYMDRFTDAEISSRADTENLTIESLSFIFQDLEYEEIEDPAYFRYFSIGSECQLAFIRQINTLKVIPVLMITGVESLQDTVNVMADSAFPRIGYLKTTINEEGIFNEIKDIISTDELDWIPEATLELYEVVYPRIRINSANIKNSEDELSILRNGSLLTNYEDYSVLTRGDNSSGRYQNRYYLTIKPEVIFRSGKLEGIYRCNFAVSNTDLIMYLDAIQVLKENSIPQVSYTVEPSVFNIDFIKQIYKFLNRIVHINDFDLKFENVKGYISELEINLDMPEEDQITITDYKTKFEDLFSSIVAQTEEMKKNSTVIGMASSLFTTTGQLSSEVIQGALLRPDLTYAFNQGALTIDEGNGIWATSDSGVVAYRGGGIFTATEQDENGEWLWNTGILPSGINANLITSGQLDTNLIRIYAGDNLKFQLNGKGLFAYKSWLDDSPEVGSNADVERTEEYLNYALQPAQYVVHDSDGLFLRAKKGAKVLNDTKTEYVDVEQDIDRVAISWDGLVIRNWDNEKVFYADGLGNLTLTGTIHAKAGDFEGDVRARSLTILSNEGGETKETDIDKYVNDRVDASAGEIIQEFEAKDGELRSYIERVQKGLSATPDEAANEKAKLLADTVEEYVKTLPVTLDNLICIWFNEGEPTSEKIPLRNWGTEGLKSQHAGDLYYDKHGILYYWNGTEWVRSVTGVDILTQLEKAAQAVDTIDFLRQVYLGETNPTLPYYIGDIWKKSDSEVLRCQTTRESGAFTSTDWVPYDEYYEMNSMFAESVKNSTDIEANSYEVSLRASQIESALGDTNKRLTQAELNLQPDKIVSTVRSSQEYQNDRTADKNELQGFVNGIQQSLQAQIDGQIETHFYDYNPALDKAPSNKWISEEDKIKHEGDLFFNKSNGYAYRFFKDGDNWVWQRIQDTDITKALQDAANAQTTANSKRRVFVTTPQPPYDIGDLWFNSTTSDIMTCITARTIGDFNSGDWEKRNKYTDDTRADEAYSRAEQGINYFSWIVNNPETSSATAFTLTPKMANLVTDSINFKAASFQVVVKQKVDESLNEINIGGRNYVLDGSFKKGFERWSDCGEDVPEIREIVSIGGKNWLHIKSSGIGRWQGSQQNPGVLQGVTITGGQKYTISARVRSEAENQPLSIGIHWKPMDNLTILEQSWQEWNIDTNEQIVSFTITSPVNCSIFNILLCAGNSSSGNYTTVGDVYFTDIKVELGDKRTDWSPAPEDTESQITDVNNQLGNFITHEEQAVYLRQVAGEGVYVGFENSSLQAFIDASGWFRVMNNGESISSLGPRVQYLGTLKIYETADGGHAFI